MRYRISNPEYEVRLCFPNLLEHRIGGKLIQVTLVVAPLASRLLRSLRHATVRTAAERLAAAVGHARSVVIVDMEVCDDGHLHLLCLVIKRLVQLVHEVVLLSRWALLGQLLVDPLLNIDRPPLVLVTEAEHEGAQLLRVEELLGEHREHVFAYLLLDETRADLRLIARDRLDA